MIRKYFLIYYRHGHGTLSVRLSNGNLKQLYVGEWRHNKKHNHGRQYFSDGIYNGEYQCGDRSGNGMMWYNDDNESMYVGQWKRDKHHGPGVLINGLDI